MPIIEIQKHFSFEEICCSCHLVTKIFTFSFPISLHSPSTTPSLFFSPIMFSLWGCLQPFPIYLSKYLYISLSQLLSPYPLSLTLLSTSQYGKDFSSYPHNVSDNSRLCLLIMLKRVTYQNVETTGRGKLMEALKNTRHNKSLNKLCMHKEVLCIRHMDFT